MREPRSLTLTAAPVPEVPALSLDTVWFQVAGTLCNLQCRHCFISCGPTNRSHDMMTRREVSTYVREAEELGVRDFYFTGGEPLLNRQLPAILADSLRVAPVTVLTNAILVDAAYARELAAIREGSPYSLEMRVSLDGVTPAMNDPIRGEGSFEETVRGMHALAEAGFLPILTVTQTWSDAEDRDLREAFHDLLRRQGIGRPRVKVLPLFRTGRESSRTRGYAGEERVTFTHGVGHDPLTLQCSTSRMVTSRGVYVCPILVDSPTARMAGTLRESLRPFPLAHGACHTCWSTGASCRN